MSRGIILAGHVARMREMRNANKILAGKSEARDLLGDLTVLSYLR
jgi:hypothetical protein